MERRDFFTAYSACIQGRDHALQGKNCQDFSGVRSWEIGDRKCTFGVVLDGCGSGKHSEVGSSLLGTLLLNIIPEVINSRLIFMGVHNGVPEQEWVSQAVENACLNLINLTLAQCLPVIRSEHERSWFVNEFFLTTIIYSLTVDAHVFVGSAGDGYLGVRQSHNDKVVVHELGDKDNTPSYLAYRTVDPLSLKGMGDKQFNLVNFYSLDPYLLFISTDGMERLVKEDRTQELFNLGPKKLQRWMNSGHALFKPKPDPEWGFDDDTAVVCLIWNRGAEDDEGGDKGQDSNA